EAQGHQVDRAEGRNDAAARHRPLLPRPGAGGLPGAVALLAGERRHPEDLRRVVAGDHPAHGGVRHRHHGPALDGHAAPGQGAPAGGGADGRGRARRRRAGGRPARRTPHLHSVPSGCADAPGGARLAQELHPHGGDRGAAQGDPGAGPAGRDAAARRETDDALMIDYPTIEDTIGETPLVRLVRVLPAELAERGIVVLGKLEGNNPAGSVKDRPAISMIARAQARGEIKTGDTLIEATSGNTGIALAMAAAIRGYRLILIMPENQSLERRQAMKAYGAELILVSRKEGMEGARDLALRMQAEGKGRVLDQFGNDDSWIAQYEGTGPEIWRQPQGSITHFVSAMGTTGTITGVSRFLKERNPEIQIIGAQPAEGSSIAGIRKWPP